MFAPTQAQLCLILLHNRTRDSIDPSRSKRLDAQRHTNRCKSCHLCTCIDFQPSSCEGHPFTRPLCALSFGQRVGSVKKEHQPRLVHPSKPTEVLAGSTVETLHTGLAFNATHPKTVDSNCHCCQVLRVQLSPSQVIEFNSQTVQSQIIEMHQCIRRLQDVCSQSHAGCQAIESLIESLNTVAGVAADTFTIKSKLLASKIHWGQASKVLNLTEESEKSLFPTWERVRPAVCLTLLLCTIPAHPLQR